MQSHIPTIEFDPKAVTAAVEAEILAAVQEVPEIVSDRRAQIYKASLQAIRAGFDLHQLHSALTTLGLEKNRASEVARWVVGRANVVMTRERQLACRVTEAIWMHSGAPCMPNPKIKSADYTKQDTDHITANGKRFSVAKGMLINGKRVWPGQALGCKCVSKSVIPGFD